MNYSNPFMSLNIPKIIIFTGAGISAESGLSTFRGQDGIWTQFDVNKVCNFSYFYSRRKDEHTRKEIFSFYQLMLEHVQKAQPNKAHQLCTDIQKKFGKDRVHIFTTNIDDLHDKAGAENVTQVHGSITQMTCLACKHIWSVSSFDHSEKCPHCSSSVTKPNVVFFGENAPEYEKLLSITHHKRVHPNDILIVIGSSLQVVGTDFLFRFDRYHGQRDINIILNKDPTPFDHMFSHAIIGNATEKYQDVLDIVLKKFS